MRVFLIMDARDPSPDFGPTQGDERERLAQMFEQAPSLMALLREPNHRIVLANPAFRRLFGDAPIVGRIAAEVLPQAFSATGVDRLDEAFRTGEPIRITDARLPIQSDVPGASDERILDLLLQPVRDPGGDVIGIFVQGSDVTDRVLAERWLKSSFEIKTVGIIYWGPDFGLTRVNDAFLRMTGFTREEALGLTWQQLTPAEFWPASEQAVHQVNTIGEAIPYEKQYFRKDGTRWWGLFAPRRVSAEEVVEFVLDVTERREAEEAVRDREQRLRLIVDSATDYAIMTLSPERRITSWSPGAAKTFGYDAAEVLGELVDILFTPEDREAGIPAQEAETARRAQFAPNVRWHLRKDGSWVFINGSSNLLRGAAGEEIGFLKIGRDESDRRMAEDVLRETEQRYRLAAQATNDVIWDWNLQTDHLRWSEAMGTMFAYGPDDLEETGRWWKSKIHPEDRDRVVSSIERAIAGRDKGWAAQYRFERKDGSHAEVLDRGTVLRDETGQARRMVGAMHDLTPHKQAEAVLRQLNETLEHRVLEEVAARMKIEDTLRQSQKLEAIGQLTGGVAHDFNNLLTVIRGAAEMLRRPTLPEEKKARYIQAIADTADRAAKLTSQLLAFSRRQALKPEVFNVGHRIDGIRDMLATVVGAGVTLAVNTDCDVCYVEADPSQFETALVNMAVNARDAMNDVGELRIEIEPTSSIPSVRGHRASTGDFVAVRVSDSGSGIDAEKLAQIFEPFFTTKEVGKGTGLGLSQVYGFAKQSGGEVAVESAVGEGSTFTMFLPRVPAEVGEATVAQLREEAQGRGHILVVEDNEQVGAFSTDLLAELGFTTTWAPNADAALRHLAENPRHYAAVFSDVVMPGMNGVELGLEIRRREPGLPVILTSGYSHVLAQEGSHGFELLHKPYSIEDLTRVLRRAILDRSTARTR
ncbi:MULTISPECIES: PAS domain-containing hybrid sensor histidine kinase/response regulator [Sphingomonas]|uniref:histidine kinase n=1 Tax=Sphingomonas molluscorum TaxID=418184 RepID=A0ABU8Q4D2_9SPHN|nr:PAS domain S-box protein [Sphingomonas sp. JUb134]MBM7405372.1 PAS domain S-box-containing protein [Sphingomonas sp. JUb134]